MEVSGSAAVAGAEDEKRRRRGLFSSIGCFSSKETGSGPRFDRGPRTDNGRVPTHLVIMVNGIIGSAGNWRFAAKQLVERYPEDVIVHRSRCNCNAQTFDGVDTMGDRLAAEVLSIIQGYPCLEKISFVSHSLGGLIARYAIAKLYQHRPLESPEENKSCNGFYHITKKMEQKTKDKIAGLEPINFITFATPHLGSRWHKQIPFLCGFYALEDAAIHTSWILGRTGKHLCLNDRDGRKLPLLLQMATDNGDLKFISALNSFKRRVAYANAYSDHIVGWRTSSIRRQDELPKRDQFRKIGKYPHVVNVDISKADDIQEVYINNEMQKVDMEEAMIKGLNRVTWERVDVSFRKSMQRILAHSTIQVKSPCINFDGADVICHMIDNFIL